MFNFLISTAFFLTTPEVFERRIDAALLLGDTEMALKEAEQYRASDPDSSVSLHLLVKALAASGQEGKALLLWEEHTPQDHDLLEEIAWGILKKGFRGTILPSRQISLIGAALSQDVRALDFLKKAMGDSNAVLRACGVKLSAFYGDKALREDIKQLFYSEKRVEVRQEVIGALGKLKMNELATDMENQLKKKHLSREEKESLLLAISELRTFVSEKEIQIFASSESGAFRQLAPRIAAKNQMTSLRSVLYPLLDDPLPEVRSQTLFALAVLGEKDSGLFKKHTSDCDPTVGITASYALFLADSKEGEIAFDTWLSHKKPHVARKAAAACAKTGSKGVFLMKKYLEIASDPYVKANLAIGLLRERESIEKASEILYTFLAEHREKIMWQDGFFEALDTSTLSHHAVIANFPEAMSQMVRLEILNLLAACDDKVAVEAIKLFLKQKRPEIVGAAGKLILGAGDESAISLIGTLLEDPDKEIRIGAALLLASSGRDEKALPVLLEAYPHCDRTMKIKILESLGSLGSRDTLPFLVKELKDPSEVLRLIVSAIIIQILHG